MWRVKAVLAGIATNFCAYKALGLDGSNTLLDAVGILCLYSATYFVFEWYFHPDKEES